MTSRALAKNIIANVEPLAKGSNMLATLDPFLFGVYHVDHYPAGDSKMRAPRRGDGADFNHAAEYRMYHGDDIPGFPQHPHRGFETLTATIEGIIDHADSLGNAGRYGQGDLQWMTAGRGVKHGEMFPLINQDKPNPTKFFQIWLNLPRKNKMVDPDFAMHWAESIPHYHSPDGKVDVTVWAGEFEGLKPLAPPRNSYGADPASELGVWFLEIAPGGRVRLPVPPGGNSVNRRAYFLEGSGSISIGEQSIPVKSEITLNAGEETEIWNNSPADGKKAEILVLQGRPLNEPVVQHGPFVMNTQAEIMQAFKDYQETEFGGWPWPEDALIFPREKGRFALSHGQETFPPKKN